MVFFEHPPLIHNFTKRNRLGNDWPELRRYSNLYGVLLHHPHLGVLGVRHLDVVNEVPEAGAYDVHSVPKLNLLVR